MVTALDIPLLCEGGTLNLHLECSKCGVGKNTGVIIDEEEKKDVQIIESWLQKIKFHITSAGLSLLRVSREWWQKEKRIVVFIANYDSPFAAMHSSQIQAVPAELLQEFFETELASLKIPDKLDFKLFNPEEHVAVLIRMEATRHEKEGEP